MKFEDAAARWVEKEYGFEVGTVTDVYFDMDAYSYSGGCPTCDYGSPVELDLCFKHNGQYIYRSIENHSLQDILSALFDIADGES